MEFLNQVIDILIPLVIPVVASAIAMLIREVVRLIRLRATAEQFTLLKAIAFTAVQAAEQVYAQTEGPAKKQAALQMVTDALAAKGIKFDAVVIEAAIEEAVRLDLEHNPIDISDTEELSA